jgi:hypothetical protein
MVALYTPHYGVSRSKLFGKLEAERGKRFFRRLARR